MKHLNRLEQFGIAQEQLLYQDHASSQLETKAAPLKACPLPKRLGALKFAALLSNYALRQMTILLACSISILADLLLINCSLAFSGLVEGRTIAVFISACIKSSI
jgi:hypothetical protein